MINNIYESFNFSNSYKKKLINFLKNNKNVETGGNKLFNGLYDHLLQIPEEFASLIIELKKLDKKSKITSFLEIGFSHGYSNNILYKFFKFTKNVAVDKFGPHINGYSLVANLRFKNLILFCGNLMTQVSKNLEKLKKFDLIFIDGDHSYDAVKNDFKLSLNLSHKKTVYIFHDICHAESGSEKF